MNRIAFAFASAVVVAAVAGASGCTSTTVTVLTQAPPGRRAALDVDTHTLTLSQGLAVALECTQYDENAGYSGPCRDMSVTSGDDVLASILPVHLDALGGQQVGDYDTFGGTGRRSAPASSSPPTPPAPRSST